MRGQVSAAAIALSILCSAAAAPPGTTPFSTRVTEWRTLYSARSGAVVDIDALFALRDVFGLSVSPDGARLAFIERTTSRSDNETRDELIVAEIVWGASGARLGALRRFSLGTAIPVSRDGRRNGAGLRQRPIWSRDGRALMALNHVDDRIELWRLQNETWSRLAPFEGDVQRFHLADAGAAIVVTATPRALLAADRVRAHRDGFRITERFEPLYSLAPLPAEDAGRTIWRVDLATGAVASAREEEVREGDDEPASGPRIATVGDTEVHRPLLRLEYRSPSGVRTACLSLHCEGPITAVWPLTEGVVLFQRSVHAGAESALYLWDVANVEPMLLHQVAGEIVQDCALASDEVLCFSQSPRQPKRLIAIELRRDRRARHEVLYDPNSDWRTRALPRIDRLDTLSASGDHAFAHLVYPYNWRPGRRYPVVIVQYRSRGFLNAGVSGEYPVYPIAALDCFVLSVDRAENEAVGRRMSTVEWQRQTELDGSEVDIKIAQIHGLIAALTTRGLIDPDRIAITGMSDGAETVYAMMNDRYPFAAAIVSGPPRDPIAWSLMADVHRQSLITRFEMRPPWDQTSSPWNAWWHRSAFFHADAYRTPILFNLPESEALNAMPLLTRLNELGAPAEAYLYLDAQHGKSAPAQLLAIQRRNLAWLRFWLRDDIIADSDDPERVSRWEALRRP